MNNQDELSNLFDAYLNGRCTTEDIERLLQFFEAGTHESVLRALVSRELETAEAMPADSPWRADIDMVYKELRAKIPGGRVVTAWQRWRPWLAAAALAGIMAGSFMLWRMERGRGVPAGQTAKTVGAPGPVEYTRHLTLPDGSIVVVRGGSVLNYPPAFGGKTREVTLTGEAYFSVRDKPGCPFIVHTGDVTTTVLGTAFYVRSGPDSITITVSSGKVKVERASALLAVLTENNRLTYDLLQHAAGTDRDLAQHQPAWMGRDLVFDGTPFDSIAVRIGRRYNIPIAFTNSRIAVCPISATFNGTETLDEVLTVLCAARNATYSIRDGRVLIDGQGCD